MTTITQLIKAFMALVSAGGILRIMALIFQIINEPDLKDMNVRKIKNVILFMILTILIYSLKDIIFTYYK